MMTGLQYLVKHYQENFLPKTEQFHEFYESLDDLEVAIQYAAEARTHHEGGKHPHQYRLNNELLREMGVRLVQKSAQIEKAESFDEIFQIVSSCKIKGFGELAIYDTSFRIGTKLVKLPEYVYLHAGTRIGAMYLTNVQRKEKIDMKDLPLEVRSLKVWQVEDFLCIYKEQIKMLIDNRDLDFDQLGDFCLLKRRGNIIC